MKTETNAGDETLVTKAFALGALAGALLGMFFTLIVVNV